MGKTGLISGLVYELKKISWPTKQEAIKLTIVVFTISLIVGAYLGIIDILLAKMLEYLTTFK
jgi:preprotein translocase SecE subunit